MRRMYQKSLAREARREREEEKGEKDQEGRKACSRPFSFIYPPVSLS